MSGRRANPYADWYSPEAAAVDSALAGAGAVEALVAHTEGALLLRQQQQQQQQRGDHDSSSASSALRSRSSRTLREERQCQVKRDAAVEDGFCVVPDFQYEDLHASSSSDDDDDTEGDQLQKKTKAVAVSKPSEKEYLTSEELAASFDSFCRLIRPDAFPAPPTPENRLSLYQSYTIVGNTCFTPKDLHIKSLSAREKKDVGVVLEFFGLGTSFDDLQQVYNARPHLSFDPASFIKHLFRTIDSSHSGGITREEFHVFLQDIDQTIWDNARQQKATLDKFNDGQAGQGKAGEEERGQDMSKMRHVTRADADRLFDLVDKDHNNDISFSELQSALPTIQAQMDVVVGLGV